MARGAASSAAPACSAQPAQGPRCPSDVTRARRWWLSSPPLTPLLCLKKPSNLSRFSLLTANQEPPLETAPSPRPQPSAPCAAWPSSSGPGKPHLPLRSALPRPLCPSAHLPPPFPLSPHTCFCQVNTHAPVPSALCANRLPKEEPESLSPATALLSLLLHGHRTDRWKVSLNAKSSVRHSLSLPSLVAPSCAGSDRLPCVLSPRLKRSCPAPTPTTLSAPRMLRHPLAQPGASVLSLTTEVFPLSETFRDGP